MPSTFLLHERIERLAGLDRFSQPLVTALQRVLRPGPTRDLLSGRAIGHPAHPAIVSAPVGCWTGALVADLAGERRAARRLTAAGVLTALPTAAAGASDWADTSGAEQRVGLVHLGANVLATAAYAASWAARATGRHRLGVGLGVAGASLATAGGWLGGHLAYGLGVGVDTNSFAGGPTTWTPVRDTRPDHRAGDDVALSAASVDGITLVVVRPPGPGPAAPVAVLGGRCSHRGAPLAEGRIVAGCVECPWHRSRFDPATGAVRQGPASVAQPVYQVREQDGTLEVRRDEVRALRLNSARA